MCTAISGKPPQSALYGYSSTPAAGTSQVVSVTAPSATGGSKLVLADGSRVDPFSATAKGGEKGVGFNKSTGSQAGLTNIYAGNYVQSPLAKSATAQSSAPPPVTTASPAKSKGASAEPLAAPAPLPKVQEAFAPAETRSRRQGRNKGTTLITGGQGLFGAPSTTSKQLFGQ